MKRILCLILVLAMALNLSGCSLLFGAVMGNPFDHSSLKELITNVENETHYRDMTYTRPDLTQLEELLDEACQAAENGDMDGTISGILAFYDAYDWYYTNYSLADIRYSGDLTDTEWEAEYTFCVENSARVDAMLEELYYALAASPVCEDLERDYFGEGWFDAYQGENQWDSELIALMEEESGLINQYYVLSAQAAEYTYGTEEYRSDCGDAMVALLVELIDVRHRIADHWGYDSYPQFASDFYYYRDYTQEEIQGYLDDVCRELVPLYRELNLSDEFYVNYNYASQRMVYQYVKTMAERMGGSISEAFSRMDQGGLYDITYSDNKFNASFEVYLTMYDSPFIFMNPTLSDYDQLTFSHEFGHFCYDFATGGNSAGVDVLEIFSQAMEYLSLCYADGGSELVKMKMWDSLSLFVEQSAFACFENRMYDLEGEELTAENLIALYDEVAQAFGFDSLDYDSQEFVTITHFYTNPMYVISYVVSNDSAMQFYQMEQAKSGDGLACFEKNLCNEADYFLEFLPNAGLESPFSAGRVASLRETFVLTLK